MNPFPLGRSAKNHILESLYVFVIQMLIIMFIPTSLVTTFIVVSLSVYLFRYQIYYLGSVAVGRFLGSSPLDSDNGNPKVIEEDVRTFKWGLLETNDKIVLTEVEDRCAICSDDIDGDAMIIDRARFDVSSDLFETDNILYSYNLATICPDCSKFHEDMIRAHINMDGDVFDPTNE